ncbi:diguanylate cyclase/phosphodiesterase (GGDEF / EAL domains) with PAS/PAC sensor(s) [Desulfurella amilsii]|uniref:Diguanylate cyclase/phosphodiesterase (GGDEF / EAL domains) with PAS/PAC sensor(S) n=1 Tax=Desulfurella amilsii TaxID=1562698 RepID=A0A1X4Y083_9BACT|nr:EAL domain-containing protein [Desulfurella amilsii]OSS43174.1 diguanylate cyclase/phosphodiesterase (GGDEF / EAL domains) with PAS/PAC sensor(s) [Desulfurella amilsii]
MLKNLLRRYKKINNYLNVFGSSDIFGVFVYQENGKIVYANKTLEKLLGYEHEGLLNKSFFDFLKVDFDTLNHIKDIVLKRLSGELFAIELKEYFFCNKHGIKIPVSIFAYTVDFEGKPSGLILVFDKSKEKSYEKLFFALSQINQLTIRQNNENDLLKAVCDVLVDKVSYSACVLGVVKNKKFKAIYKRAKNYIDESSIDFDLEVKPQNVCNCSVSKAYFSKKISLIQNVSQTLNCEGDFFSKFNVRSTCAIPILKNAKVSYIILIVDTLPDTFDDKFLHLLNEIQEDLIFALNKIEKDRFSLLTFSALNQSNELVVICDSNFRIIFVNEGNYLSSDAFKVLIGKEIAYLFDKEQFKIIKSSFYNTLKKGEAFLGLLKYDLKEGSKEFYTSIYSFVDSGRITHYILIAKEVSQKEELKDKLYKLMHFDEATGFINLNTFIYTCELFFQKVLEHSQISSIMVINPIQFKNINHAFGYEMGNKILQEIALRLKQNIRLSNVIAKLESDRFGILIKDLKTPEDVLVITVKLLNELSKPYMVESHKILLSFNIGLSFFPNDSKNAKDLLNKAQVALVDARQKGENQAGFFRKDIETKSSQKLKLKAELELAVLNKKFIPFYQPYVDKDKNIVGAEALLRWNKNGKILLPGKFLSILEDTSLIVDVESMVLNQVLGDFKTIKSYCKHLVPISVNLSIQSLMQKHLAQSLVSNLKYFGINEPFLRIEIIERSFFNDFNYIRRLIDELRQSSVHFAIDDFGTGYSSLSYLTKLNVEFLKIDISFVRGLSNTQTKNITKSIIYLAHSLNLKTIAEGVESMEQFEILKNMDCDYFQGYLFYKPLPKEEFFEIIKCKGGVL